jgi:hypothetical protein
MKQLIYFSIFIHLISCSNSKNKEFELQNIQSLNPTISAILAGEGFNKETLQIRPDLKTQSILIWEGSNASEWADANYLVCEIWHKNDYSAILNLEFFRDENRAGNIVAQSGDLAGKLRGWQPKSAFYPI